MGLVPLLALLLITICDALLTMYPSCQITCLRNNCLGNIHPVFIHQIIGCLQLSHSILRLIILCSSSEDFHPVGSPL